MIGRGAPDTMVELAFAVEIELKLTTSIHVYHIFASFIGGEDRLVLRGEILELYTWGEVVHTKGGYSQGLGVVLRGNWFSFHLTIVPECSLYTFLSLERTL